MRKVDDMNGDAVNDSLDQPTTNESYKTRTRREKAIARAVNAKESEDFKRSRNSQRKKQAGEGISENLLRRVVKIHKGDPKRQVTSFVAQTEMPAAIGRKREVSDKTRSDFGDILMRAVVDCRKLGVPIQNIDQLGLKHAIALFVQWKEQGQVAATIQTKISALRKFFLLIGKPELLPKGQKLYTLLAEKGIDFGGMRRTQIATKSKSWSMNGVDFEEVQIKVYEKDPLVGLQLKLIARFGLRVNEVVHLMPNVNQVPNALQVYDGAKGGKPRLIAYSLDPAIAASQRAVFEEACTEARKHPRDVLRRKGESVKQTKKRFHNMMQMCGITKAVTGVTAHGLRHEYAADKYEEVSGLRPPVEGAHTAQEYEDRLEPVELAELSVSGALGHARPSISNAYNGSRFQLRGAKMTRESRMLLNNLVKILEQNRVANVFQEHGTHMAWLTGSAVWGEGFGTARPIEISVRMKDEGDGVAGMSLRFRSLRAALDEVVQRKVVLVNWLDEKDPDPVLDGYVRVFGW